MKGEDEVERFVEFAERVAEESAGSDGGERRGERVGVVVVERRGGRGKVVAVAGDGRWDGWGCGKAGQGQGSGNVFAHAAMRAIGMVAAGLKAREDGEGAESSCPEDDSTDVVQDDIFKDAPLSLLEKTHYDPSGNANGYLCHELEIYCTHEPCVMCSMAIVHSRFGRVVFKRRMPETGGICADGELGHGLFWRKELNWTLLGWQWICEDEEDGDVSPYLHA